MSSEPRFQRALVTGASSGIGEALCYLLAGKGIDLIITGRDESRLQAVAEGVGALVSVDIVVADLAVEAERQRVVDKIWEHRPGLVVNNAGFGLYGDAVDLEVKKQHKMLHVNIDAVVELTIEAARAMRKNGQPGTILNVSSVAGMFVFPGFASYAASKSFVNAWTEAVDFELRGDGIRVLAACPGQVRTQFRGRAAQGADSGGASSHVMTPDFAAKQIWQQICRGTVVRAFDGRYRLSAWFRRLLPKSWVFPMLRNSVVSRLQSSSVDSH